MGQGKAGQATGRGGGVRSAVEAAASRPCRTHACRGTGTHACFLRKGLTCIVARFLSSTHASLLILYDTRSVPSHLFPRLFLVVPPNRCGDRPVTKTEERKGKSIPMLIRLLLDMPVGKPSSRGGLHFQMPCAGRAQEVWLFREHSFPSQSSGHQQHMQWQQQSLWSYVRHGSPSLLHTCKSGLQKVTRGSAPLHQAWTPQSC